MKEIPMNLLALIVTALGKSFLGFIWYSPGLFGKAFMTLSGCNPEKAMRNLPRALLIDVLGNFIMAFVLVHAAVYAGAANFAQGMAVGFFNWLGLIAVAMFFSVNFEQRPFKLFLLNNGFQFIATIAMGGVLAIWR
jgi:hypothetical protein